MRNRPLNRLIFVLLASSVTLSGCVTLYNPATERRESYLIDTRQEVELGRNMDTELRKQMKFVTDPRQNRRLIDIGNRIAEVSDRQDLTYHFFIVEDKDLNAFAIPGGYIYVHSGLMQAANDAELAGVLAHEIGHIAARHSVKQLQTVMGYQIVLGIITGVSGTDSINGALNVVFNLVNLGYSRQDEFLADKLAVRYTRRAGFSPLGLVTFFQKLQNEAEARGPSLKLVFLSSHPPTEQRILRIDEEMRLPSN